MSSILAAASRFAELHAATSADSRHIAAIRTLGREWNTERFIQSDLVRQQFECERALVGASAFVAAFDYLGRKRGVKFFRQGRQGVSVLGRDILALLHFPVPVSAIEYFLLCQREIES